MNQPANIELRLTHVSPSEAVVVADVGDEAVLLNVDTGVYYGLDETGSRIWSLLAEGHNVDIILGLLLDEYDIDEDQLRRDVVGFIDRLIELQLARTGVS